VLRAPELDAGLPGGSHENGAEGQNQDPDIKRFTSARRI